MIVTNIDIMLKNPYEFVWVFLFIYGNLCIFVVLLKIIIFGAVEK